MRFVRFLPICFVSIACGSEPGPALHLGRLEMAWAEVVETLKGVHDLPSAKSAVVEIRQAYERVRQDRDAIRAMPASRIGGEQKKRIEALNKQMTTMMITILQLPAVAKAYVHREIGELDFTVAGAKPKKK